MFSTTITSEMVNDFIAKALNAGIDLGGRILAALIIFIIGKFLINWANKLFATMLQKRHVDASIQSFLKSIVNITLLVMLFLVVIGKLGIELTSFAALLASVGVAVGMALSGNLSNFAGGVIILVFRPYKVGDYIEASTGASGTVTDIQIFHTVLTTPDNKVIFAPNGAMSGAVVTNYSRKDTRRLDFTFGVEYGTDFNQAKAIILEIINKDNRIMKDPAPFIELGALADSSVNITVRVWVNASDYWAVNFDMNKNVYATFNERASRSHSHNSLCIRHNKKQRGALLLLFVFIPLPLPSITLAHPFFHLIRKLVVLQAPVGSYQQLLGRLRHETLQHNVGTEMLYIVNGQIDVLISRIQMEIIRLMLVLRSHTRAFYQLQLMEFQGGQWQGR